MGAWGVVAAMARRILGQSRKWRGQRMPESSGKSVWRERRARVWGLA